MRRHGLICLAILLAVSFISDPVSAEEIRGQVATRDFEWNAQNFGGFYYDIDKDLGTESITTYVVDGKLDEPNGVILHHNCAEERL